MLQALLCEGPWLGGKQRCRADLQSGDKPRQLQDVAAALRHPEKDDERLLALSHLQQLVEANPDELKHLACECCMHCLL